MKRIVRVMALVSVLAFSMAAPTFAAGGGMPAAHGVEGRTFGGAVAGLAQVAPLALAGHFSGR